MSKFKQAIADLCDSYCDAMIDDPVETIRTLIGSMTIMVLTPVRHDPVVFEQSLRLIFTTMEQATLHVLRPEDPVKDENVH